jgi:hypothetical protein
MRGSAAHDAEVVAGLHDACAEKLLPEAVHGDACGERILGIDKPLRETKTVLRRIGSQFAECGGHSGIDLLADFVIGTTHEDVRHRFGVHLLLLNVGDGAAGLDGFLLGGELGGLS